MASGKNSGSSKKQNQQTNGATLGEEIDEVATEASQTVKGAAGDLSQNFRQQITSQVTMQQERAVDTLDTVALLFQQAGEHARKADKETIAQLTDQAAEQVERFSTVIRERQPEQLLSETRQLAQKQPGLFIGGALVAGFLGARFLRSSAQQASTGTEQQSGSGEAQGQDQSNGTSTDGAGGYGAESWVDPDVPVVGTAIGTGAATGLTDPAMAEGTILEEDVALIEYLENQQEPGNNQSDTFPDDALETR